MGGFSHTPAPASSTGSDACYHQAMVTTRKKTTVYLTPELLRAVKARAASTGRHDYEIVEDALRQYLDTPGEMSREALKHLLDELAESPGLNDAPARKSK
jgi:hypothetical protein